VCVCVCVCRWVTSLSQSDSEGNFYTLESTRECSVPHLDCRSLASSGWAVKQEVWQAILIDEPLDCGWVGREGFRGGGGSVSDR
jgi:hypothetical protein